jgi:membrane-bound ClpP family serine protease
MVSILLLFLIGVALLAADVFVSSFLLAIFGGAVMLTGCGVAYRDFGFMGALLAVAIALALLGATLYVELVLLPRTRFGRGLVVQSTSGAASQPPLASADVVGRPAVALTTLAPSGYVLVEERRYEAFCRSGHAAKGAVLKVVGLDNFRLIVSKND